MNAFLNPAVVLPFLLGIISTIVVQYLLDKKRLKRIKGSIKANLEDSILESCNHLIEDYQLCEHQLKSEHGVKIRVFESFNSEIYKANHPADYYKLYYSPKKRKDKFSLLNSIYSVISFLKENLPYEMSESYHNEIEEHLDKNTKSDETRKEHRLTCMACRQIEEKYGNLYNMRIAEVKELQSNIGLFLNK